jgi:hypothetical protein
MNIISKALNEYSRLPINRGLSGLNENYKLIYKICCKS